MNKARHQLNTKKKASPRSTKAQAPLAAWYFPRLISINSERYIEGTNHIPKKTTPTPSTKKRRWQASFLQLEVYLLQLVLSHVDAEKTRPANPRRGLAFLEALLHRLQPVAIETAAVDHAFVLGQPSKRHAGKNSTKQGPLIYTTMFLLFARLFLAVGIAWHGG